MCALPLLLVLLLRALLSRVRKQKFVNDSSRSGTIGRPRYAYTRTHARAPTNTHTHTQSNRIYICRDALNGAGVCVCAFVLAYRTSCIARACVRACALAETGTQQSCVCVCAHTHTVR